MSEKKSHPRRLVTGVVIAALFSVACSKEKEPPIAVPDVESYAKFLEGRSRSFAFAFGLGLTVGCNPEVLLDDDGNLSLDTEQQEALDAAKKEDPQGAEDGLTAGITQGSIANNTPESPVC